MPDFASTSQREQVAINRLRSIEGLRLNPKSIRKAGSLINIQAHMAIALAEEVEARIHSKNYALTLAGAFGSDLDAWVAEHTFGLVSRNGSAPAVVDLKFTRPSSGALLSLSIPAGYPIDMDGVTFTLDAALTFGASATTSSFGTATASYAGAATNVSETAVLVQPNISTLSDLTIVPVLTSVPAGGADTELDVNLKRRVPKFVTALRRGTLGAIEFGALTVAGIHQAAATESLDSNGFPTGGLSLYLGDVNGNCNNALLVEVRRVLREWRCCGVRIHLVGSIPYFQAVTLALTYKAGFSTLRVQELVRAAVIASFDSLEPNEVLYRSSLIAAIKGVEGVIVSDSSIISPSGDVMPSTGQRIRTKEGMISFT